MKIHVETAGTLPSLIKEDEKYKITSLILTGNLNGTDIRSIREMAGGDVYGNETSGNLSVLDLSGANIVNGGGYYFNFNGNQYYTGDNGFRDYTFSGCIKLTVITIPNNITTIGLGTFHGCVNLKEIIAVSDNKKHSSLDDVLFSEDKTTLVSHLDFKAAFYIIPNRVTEIGESAIGNHKEIESIIIPNSVTSIGSKAFHGCSKLREFIVASNNKNYLSLDGVLLNKDKTILVAYPNAKAASYTIPNSVTSIGKSAFLLCTNLTSVTIGDSVTSIGFNAFSHCSKLSSITISNNVSEISLWAFSYCKGLTSVTIPNSVTSIEGGLFWCCSGLTSITIPKSVTAIGDSVFRGCSGLKEIYSANPIPPTCGSYVFEEVSRTNCKLYVPKGSSRAYSKAKGWKEFKNIIKIDMNSYSNGEVKKNMMKTFLGWLGYK